MIQCRHLSCNWNWINNGKFYCYKELLIHLDLLNDEKVNFWPGLIQALEDEIKNIIKLTFLIAISNRYHRAPSISKCNQIRKTNTGGELLELLKKESLKYKTLLNLWEITITPNTEYHDFIKTLLARFNLEDGYMLKLDSIKEYKNLTNKIKVLLSSSVLRISFKERTFQQKRSLFKEI
ncbi:hypothetical protein [Piscirickettsia litoralis]|uniref:Uncharacterized protein n=1 Tax=Piscirickettsia litoralis TaxID=1891921 RepID=A0ABX3A4I6_9GAMM|nr:hypothetical protein [Piscirickettsia litoralis]ODN42576.1 hypothetical protein BGC07_06065 [Piscirickettsia litoralis]